MLGAHEDLLQLQQQQQQQTSSSSSNSSSTNTGPWGLSLMGEALGVWRGPCLFCWGPSLGLLQHLLLLLLLPLLLLSRGSSCNEHAL